VVTERINHRQYHTFLCHNRKDKQQVRLLYSKLIDQGILAWLDEDGIYPGEQFISELENILDKIPSAIVVFGPHSLGPWQTQEYHVLLQRYVEHRNGPSKRLRMIPVLMPGAPADPERPPFLRAFDYIDFRHGGLDDRDSMRRLVKAIVDGRTS
jgi:hypothetical protein